MKPLSPAADLRRFESSQSLAWLLDLDGPGLTLRASTLPVMLGGDTYEPLLLETPDWRMETHGDFAPGGLIATRATLRLADVSFADPSSNPASSFSSLAASLLRASASGFAATLQLVWLDTEGEADPIDAIVMLRGGLASFIREPGAVRLELTDLLSSHANRSVLRNVDDIDTASPNLPAIPTDLAALQGRTLPVVFGVHDRLDLFPFELGPRTELIAPLGEDDDQAFVASLDHFPTSGIAQIGDELIQFDALDPDNPSGPALGTPAQPIIRLETPEAHALASIVRAEPAAGFTWFVADHVCESVTDPRASGEPFTGTWSAENVSLDDRTVQLLRLDRVPTGAVTARVEGWSLLGGGAAANPVDVLEILLTDARFAGLDPALLEMASFLAIRSELAAAGCAFARVLGSTSLRLIDLLDSAAREMAAWLRSGPALLTLARAEPIPPITTLASLGSATALDPLAEAETIPEPSPLPSGLRLDRHAPNPVFIPETPVPPNPSSFPFFLSFDPPPGGSNANNPPIVQSLDWLDGRSDLALGDFARRIAPPLSDARTRARHRVLPAHAVLEPGDPVDLTRPPIGLAADGLWVNRLLIRSPSAIELHLEGPLAGPACFSAGGETGSSGALGPVSFVRPFGGGCRLLMALEGDYVARLTWNGRLSIVDKLIETDALAFTPPWDPAIGPIGLHDDGVGNIRLVFATGEMASFEPFLLFEEFEAALTSATLVENVPLPAPPSPTPPDPPLAPDCVLADDDGFTLFPHPSAAALHYDTSTNELRLAGELMEGAPLDGS